MSRITITSFILLGAFAFLTGCNPTEKDKADSQTPEIEEEKRQWAWNNYPVRSELLLGTIPVSVHPKKSIDIKAEATGVLTVELGDQVTNVEKGRLWALMNTERLTSREEKIKIQERKQSLGNIKVEELELPEKEAKAYEDLVEARKKVKLMEKMMKSKVMDEMSNLLGVSGEDVSEEALKKAKEALALAERKMEFAQKYEYKLRQDEKRLIEMDLTESKRAYHEAKSQSEYHIPFNGEFRLNLALIPNQSEYTVVSREVLGTLSDYTEIHAYLGVQNAGWISLPPESLRIKIKNKEKTEMTFLDDRYIKNARGKEERNYLFMVPMNDNTDLKRLTGSKIDADLLHGLKSPCHIVPKLELSLYAMNRSEEREWAGIIKDLFPEAELVAEGLEHVAIAIDSGQISKSN